jgi:hypothetical protein
MRSSLVSIMCGEVWDNVTKNLAQKIGGKSRGDYLQGALAAIRP